MVSTLGIKVIAAIATAILAFTASLLPYKIRSSKRLLSVLNVLASGVFLGAGLAHLLAASAGQFTEYFEEQEHAHDDHLMHGEEGGPFPWAFVLCGVGFISTLFIEEIGHYLVHKMEHSRSQNNSTETTSVNNSAGGASDSLTNIDNLFTTEDNNAGGNAYNALASPAEDDRAIGYTGIDENNGEVQLHNTTRRGGGTSAHGDHYHKHDDVTEQHNHCDDDGDDGHDHSHVPLNTEGQSLVMVVTLLLALSWHSIIEGLVLGSSDGKSIKSMLLAVLAHKGLESFALGAGLLRSGATWTKFLMFTIGFALTTPFGILIGSFVSNFEGPFMAGVSGFGAGTFCYVAIVEVLVPELQTKQDKIPKLLCLSVGFLFMSILALWV